MGRDNRNNGSTDRDTDVVIEERPSKDDTKDSPAIEVDIEKKEPEKKEEPKYVTIEELEPLRKQLNGLSSVTRHLKDIPTQLAELRAAIQSDRTLTPREKEDAKDELDELVDKGEWKTAVRKLAGFEAQAILRQKEEEAFRKQAEQNSISILEDNKRTVLERYPDLNDPESELTRKYIDVRNRYPRFNKTEEGPLLAMYKMEEELREEGKLDQYTKRIVDKEVQRQVRTAATSIPKSTSGTSRSENKITLTREQKEFCDSTGLKYEDYAKSLKQMSLRQGVEA